MKFLITIVLTLLLSLAFLTQFEVEAQKIKNVEIFIPASLDLLFLLGIFIIFFSFLKYKYPEKKFNIIADEIIILLVGLFVIFYGKFFIDALNSAIGDSGNILENLWNSRGKLNSSIILKLGVMTLLLIIIYRFCKKILDYFKK